MFRFIYISSVKTLGSIEDSIVNLNESRRILNRGKIDLKNYPLNFNIN